MENSHWFLLITTLIARDLREENARICYRGQAMIVRVA